MTKKITDQKPNEYVNIRSDEHEYINQPRIAEPKYMNVKKHRQTLDVDYTAMS